MKTAAIILGVLGAAALFALSVAAPPEREAGAQGIPAVCDEPGAFCFDQVARVEDRALGDVAGDRLLIVDGPPGLTFPYDPTNDFERQTANRCWQAARKAQTNRRTWFFVRVAGPPGAAGTSCGNVLAP